MAGRRRCRGGAAVLAGLAALVSLACGAAAAAEATPAAFRGPIAVLPTLGLAPVEGSTAAVAEGMRERLSSRGLEILAPDRLEAFLVRHRVRYTGGLDDRTIRALRDETGAAAVLVTAVDLFRRQEPPRIGMVARLVSTAEPIRILWMEDAQLAGDQAPGFLGFGIVRDVATLRVRVLDALADSLATGAAWGFDPSHRTAIDAERGGAPHGDRFRPRSFYASGLSPTPGARTPRIAVMPFDNESTTRDAGRTVTLLLERYLADRPDVELVEPGLVRQAILETRLVQQEGLSLAQAEALTSLLDVDVAITGNVRDYLGATAAGPPRAEFTVSAIDVRERRVAWASVSYNSGDDRVVFFDRGRVYTVHALASAMAQEVVERMVPELAGGSPGNP